MKLATFKFIRTFNYSWQLKSQVLSRGDFSIKGGNIIVGCGRGGLPIDGEIYQGMLEIKTTDQGSLQKIHFWTKVDLIGPKSFLCHTQILLRLSSLVRVVTIKQKQTSFNSVKTHKIVCLCFVFLLFPKMTSYTMSKMILIKCNVSVAL